MSGRWIEPDRSIQAQGTAVLACPFCRSSLEEGADTWACFGCDTRFRGLRRIPDLRTRDDGYMANRDDWEFALRLEESFDQLDFRGLLERYFDLASDIPAEQRCRQVAHILSAPARARQWLELLGPVPGAGRILDLGCGSGSFLATAATPTRELWGIDIALRWLLVARKRLDEAGLSHVRLVCGCAEQLPLLDRSFAGVVAGDVIEHVADQAATLAESYRVLRPGGRLVLAAPNRFSLTPEPHVGVWGVGYLPRRLMAGYVRMVRRVDFRAIHTLGHGEWKRLLRQSPFGGGLVSAPALPPTDLARFGPLKRWLAVAYNRVVKTAAGHAVARAVGPLFHVCCTRPCAEAQGPTQPTRQRSRPPGATG